MTKLIVSALFAVVLTGCGAPSSVMSASIAPSAIEAQAAGKAAIKKAASEAVADETKKFNVSTIKVTAVKQDGEKFTATVETTGKNPFGVEERTYEVTGNYADKKATVKDVKLTRQTR